MVAAVALNVGLTASKATNKITVKAVKTEMIDPRW
jgi:hypothetical protein